MDNIFSISDFELMMDSVYFMSKYLHLDYPQASSYMLKEKRKELDELFARMVDAHDAFVNGSYNA